MALFKYKPEKLKYLSNVNTLDEVHKKHVANFTNSKQSVVDKKSKLDNHLKELSELENRSKDTFDVNDIRKRAILKENISRLEEDIYDIENGTSELEYYSRTNDILSEYYSIVDDTIEDAENGNDEHAPTDKSNTNISDKLVELNLLSQKKRKIKKQTRKRIRKLEAKPVNNILSFFEQTTQEEIIEVSDNKEQTEQEPDTIEKVISNRASLFDEYLLRIDRNYASSKKKVRTLRMCSQCNIEKTLIQSDGMYVCQKCGEVENIIIESEVPNHKEGVCEKIKYPYKRLNHLTEFWSISNYLYIVLNNCI